MSRSFQAGAGMLVPLALAACQSMPAADATAEAAAIRARDAAWVAAVAGKDVDKVVAFYSDDAWFMPPNEDAKTGADIRKAWEEFVKLPGAVLTFAPTRIEVDGDGAMAIDVGTYDFSFDGPNGKVTDHGKYAQTWEKKDGAWKVAVDMYNSSVPMAPPAPPAAAAPPKAPEMPAAPKAPKKKK